MVEVGQMSIKGTIDTSDIERGTQVIINNFYNAKSQIDSSASSFTFLEDATSKVASSLAKIGTIGLTAMTGLASISPQVAPAMASIANETRKLSFALGEQLSPLFESIGQDLIPAINQALENLAPITDTLVESATQGLKDIASALKGEWDKIDNIIPKGAGVALGIAIGSSFGLPGMLIGASLGYIAGDLLGKGIDEIVQDPINKTDELVTNTNTAIESATKDQAFFGGVYKGAKLVLDPLYDMFALLKQWTNYKDIAFAGTTRSSG